MRFTIYKVILKQRGSRKHGLLKALLGVNLISPVGTRIKTPSGDGNGHASSDVYHPG